MSGLASLFNFGGASQATELPDLYPFPFSETDFVETDMVTIFSKILTDVVERTDGLEEKKQATLWDNCLASETADGLISLLAKAISCQGDLFIVYDSATNVVRKANATEQAEIKADYEKTGESKTGCYVSFKNYKKAQMVKLYSSLEYCAIHSLYKNMNLSKAIQFKMKEMRGSVGLSDSAQVKADAKAIADALQQGKNVMLDGEDIIDTARPDMEPTEKAMLFINNRRAFYLGMPMSYIVGEQTKSMTDSGGADAKAVERGLKPFFASIIQPVFKAVYGVDAEFKTEDYTQIDTALNVLKTFELTSNEYISAENKGKIINRQFGLPEDAKGDPIEEITTELDPVTGKPIAAPAKPGQKPPPAKPEK